MKPKLVISTGAGMSAESGIATFRDAGGLWENYPVMDVASADGFRRNPQLVHDFYNKRRAELVKAQPNAGHRGLAELEKEGKLRAIGVSNFGPDRYLDLQHFAEVKPAVNQIETHVFQQQKVAREYLRKYGCQAESWGPFAEGRKDMFTNPVLTAIGEKYGKTAAQTALRFLVQSDVVVIPKSVHQERMRQNFEIFDFRLTPEDMAAIEALDGGESLFFSHYDPKTVEWFLSTLG